MRVETGAVQFGNDWPGIFIRGDNAIAYAMYLETALKNPDAIIAKVCIEGLIKLLQGASSEDVLRLPDPFK